MADGYACPKCGKPGMTKGATAQSGKIRWVCREGGGDRTICYQTTDPTAPYRGRNRPKDGEPRVDFPAEIKKETLVITWAQNATPLHKGFFAALQNFCKTNKAQLLVIPGRYKNPTSRWEASQTNELWWAHELVPFLVNKRLELNSNLMLLADIKTQPTAVTPLTGFESITHGESGILGHPKLQMTVVPTPHQKLPKILTTTGSITTENYSDSKAGKKGEFHHVFGAVVVELEGNLFHLRHINARRDGAFIDLATAYYPDRVEAAGPYQALVLGDTHIQFTSPDVDAATFNKGGLVDRLQPKNLVFHDLLDNYAVNPHHVKNPFIKTLKHRYDLSEVEKELREACEWVENHSIGRQAFVVASNHNDFLYRWMQSQDWRDDPQNAEMYLETALEMVRASIIDLNHGAEILDPFVYWACKFLKGVNNVKLVPRNQSLMIAGIELSLHGDEGPNGAKGSIRGLSKIGAKTIIGHSHTPGIIDGCYQTGTSTALRLEYTGPVGSWLNSHVSIDPMGKRHIHTLVNNKFWR